MTALAGVELEFAAFYFSIRGLSRNYEADAPAACVFEPDRIGLITIPQAAAYGIAGWCSTGFTRPDLPSMAVGGLFVLAADQVRVEPRTYPIGELAVAVHAISLEIELKCSACRRSSKGHHAQKEKDRKYPHRFLHSKEMNRDTYVT